MATQNRRTHNVYLQLEHTETRVLQSVAPMIALGLLRPHAQVQPTDTTASPTPYQQRRMAFNAHFLGKFAQGPGLYTDQKSQIYLKAQGTSNQFIHGAVQAAFALPGNTSSPATGLANLTDKNIGQTGTQISMDLVAVPGAVDSRGRPTAFNWTMNGGSGGNYTNATGQGTLQVRYFPGGPHLHQGFVGSTGLIFQGQITTTGVSNILR